MLPGMDADTLGALLDDVATKIDGRGLTVSLVSRHIVFESNLASLTARGREVVTTLAPRRRSCSGTQMRSGVPAPVLGSCSTIV